MLTHEQAQKRKTESIDTLRACLERSSIAILTDYRGPANGLTVKQVTELRGKLRSKNGEYRVVKNTLTLRVAKELGVEGLEPYLEGPTAIAFGYDDPAGIAKTVLDYSNENKATSLPAVKAAVLDGVLLKPEQIKALADLPSREVMMAMLMGLILAPHRHILGVMNAPGRQVATVIDAWRQKQEGGSEG
ncbi:50S ribosomal protein L10 [bacterium]|nr:50S ribosomal protein L10 [bacterium]